MRPKHLVAQAVLALTLVGCGASEAAPQAGREILALGVLATSESEQPQMIGMIRGVEQAVGEYNDNPDSRYDIELKELNTQPQPGEAGAGESQIANTERLIGVIGPFALPEIQSLAPALESSGLPYMVPSVTAASIPGDGWRSYRRLIANDRQEGRELADHAAERVSGAIALVTEDSAEGEAFAEGAKEALNAAQRPASRTDTIEPGDPPITLSGVLAKDAPEAIVYGGGGASAKSLLDNLRKAEYKGLLVASHQIRELNPDGLGGGVISSSAGADPADPAVARFAERYRNRFDAAPTTFALESYEGALMLLEAVEEVQGDPRDVTDFLKVNRRFRGDSKSYEFDDRGEPLNAPVWIYESTNGGWKLSGRSDRLAQQ
ncbi:MAG TPA: branched-chain amino acid ABC transporter substrate-binding protein [Actinomycetota bacterium]|nr:branched-chain amino acid ABC transporter substrate-binding protein [Actinomycetota bacterium]